MKDPLHYSNAPITEAIISIHVSLPKRPKSSSLNYLENVNKTISYPHKQERVEQNVEVEHVADEIKTSSTSKILGYFFLSDDKKNIYQSCVDRFSFSRLKPYENWDSFQGEARRIWNVYKEEVTPESINRIAVRYINRIEVPLPCSDISEYFNFYPETPQSIEKLASVFIQTISHLQDIESMAALTLTRIKSETENKAAFILDSDIFKEINVPQSDEEMWSLFEQFRHKKNLIFTESLKESLLKEYE